MSLVISVTWGSGYPPGGVCQGGWAGSEGSLGEGWGCAAPWGRAQRYGEVRGRGSRVPGAAGPHQGEAVEGALVDASELVVAAGGRRADDDSNRTSQNASDARAARRRGPMQATHGPFGLLTRRGWRAGRRGRKSGRNTGWSGRTRRSPPCRGGSGDTCHTRWRNTLVSCAAQAFPPPIKRCSSSLRRIRRAGSRSSALRTWSRRAPSEGSAGSTSTGPSCRAVAWGRRRSPRCRRRPCARWH